MVLAIPYAILLPRPRVPSRSPGGCAVGYRAVPRSNPVSPLPSEQQETQRLKSRELVMGQAEDDLAAAKLQRGTDQGVFVERPQTVGTADAGVGQLGVAVVPPETKPAHHAESRRATKPSSTPDAGPRGQRPRLSAPPGTFGCGIPWTPSPTTCGCSRTSSPRVRA